jgi:hypothetical protein
MRRVAIQVLLFLLCAGLASQAAVAKKSAPVRDRSIAAPYWFPYPQFTDAEVRLVANWFQDGLETKHLHIASIPAAVAREVHVGARLAANMVKSLVPPPAELGGKLLPLPDGYERLLAGSVLLIIKTDEALVVDTLPVSGR